MWMNLKPVPLCFFLRVFHLLLEKSGTGNKLVESCLRTWLNRVCYTDWNIIYFACIVHRVILFVLSKLPFNTTYSWNVDRIDDSCYSMISSILWTLGLKMGVKFCLYVAKLYLVHCPRNSPHEGEIIIITDSKLLSILSPSNYSDVAVIIRTESDNLFVPLCCL